MRKYLIIYEDAVNHIDVHLLHSGFPYIRGKFDFLFYQCTQYFVLHVLLHGEGVHSYK
jgi:hypothetical protein